MEAATSPPEPPYSTMTATAILGSSAGAKPTNHECAFAFFLTDSSFSAVPVLPATLIPLIAALCPVPIF